jgi:hypothetical protein
MLKEQQLRLIEKMIGSLLTAKDLIIKDLNDPTVKFADLPFSTEVRFNKPEDCNPFMLELTWRYLTEQEKL